MSEVAPCANIVFHVSIESGAVMLNNLSSDILLVIVYNNGVEVFYGGVYFSVVVYVEVCKGVFYVHSKVFPVCLFLNCVGAFGWFV